MHFERELRARKVIAAILAAEAIAQEHVERVNATRFSAAPSA
jgi:hypothetical protein